MRFLILSVFVGLLSCKTGDKIDSGSQLQAAEQPSNPTRTKEQILSDEALILSIYKQAEFKDEEESTTPP